MEVKVVSATAKDASTIQALDLKCYHYPLENDAWSWIFLESTCVTYMVYIHKKAVGYGVIEAVGDNLRIWRLGVLKQFRGLGAAKALLKRAEELRAATKSKALDVVIPEIHCLPEDPDDVSVFLKLQGFRAVGIKKDRFDMYGCKYDGFIFERGPQ